MTLDDFFKECEKKEAIPLSYRNHREFVNGSRTVEYENPKYKKARERIAKILGTGNEHVDDVISGLYGEEVVIRTKDGFHYGTLKGYDGKSFRLENHHYDNKLMDIFDYFSRASLYGENTVVPAKDSISVSAIPLHIEKKYSFCN